MSEEQVSIAVSKQSLPTYTTWSGCLQGARAQLMQVEVAATRGLAGVEVVGGATAMTRQGVHRVLAALEQTGKILPPRRFVVSFSPMGLKEVGPHLDAAVAALLLPYCEAKNSAPVQHLAHVLILGELALDGSLKPVRGLVALYLLAREKGIRTLIVPSQQEGFARAMIERLDPGSRIHITGFSHLVELSDWLMAGRSPQPVTAPAPAPLKKRPPAADFKWEKPLARLAAAVAAGGHHILLLGPPGCGKTTFARELRHLLPPLETKELREQLCLQSLATHDTPPAFYDHEAPFRAPHHLSSAQAILGTSHCPGEMSLALGGVLFLDEFLEFRRDVLEALREPLESATLSLGRAKGAVTWPARFTLVAAANPCPCGYAGSSTRMCRCLQTQRLSYWKKLSGPLLDRLDIHVNFHGPAPRPWAPQEGSYVSSRALAGLVLQVRERTRQRNESFAVSLNRDLAYKDFPAVLGDLPAAVWQSFLRLLQSCDSVRGQLKVLRLARTFADLDGIAVVQTEHVQEALRLQLHPAPDGWSFMDKLTVGQSPARVASVSSAGT